MNWKFWCRRPKALGFKVIVKFDDRMTPHHIPDLTYRNATELHYNYPRPSQYSNYVAIESDIHGSGLTWNKDWIQEIEVSPETELAEEFSCY